MPQHPSLRALGAEGCLGRSGQLTAEVTVQEGFLKPKSCSTPQDQGQGIGQPSLGTLSLL